MLLKAHEPFDVVSYQVDGSRWALLGIEPAGAYGAAVHQGAAGSRMQTGHLRSRDELRAVERVVGHGRIRACGTQVREEASVGRTREVQRQPPALVPAPAVRVLDHARVAGETLRAVAGRTQEQPAFVDLYPAF